MSDSDGVKEPFMEMFQEKLERVMDPVADFVGREKHIIAIRDTMIAVIPFTVIGGIALLLACPPVTDEMLAGGNVFYDFMALWSTWATANASILMTPYDLTLGCLSLYVAFGIGYYLAKSYGKNGLLYGLSCLVCFFAASGAIDLSTSTIPVAVLGSKSVFGAMVNSIIVVEISRVFEDKNVTIHLPEQVPSNIAAPFNVIISSAFCIFLLTIVNSLVTSASGASLTMLVYTALIPLINVSNTIGGVLLLAFLVQLFWFFGIHASVVLSIAQPIMLANIASNAEAYAAGQPIPFVFADGVTGAFGICIANLAIVILMCVVCRSAQVKSIGRLSIVPLLFEITEPFVFGTPVILNPYFFIPFVIVPDINLLVYCLLANVGAIGKIFVELPWTTPAPIWAWLSIGSIAGLVFFVVMFIVDLFIDMPFICAYDKKMLAEENEGVVENA